MRSSRIVVLIFVIALAMLLLLPSLSWAGDIGATFSTKCAACHGADGKANTPMGQKQSIPSFASAKVQKSTPAEIEDFILNGGKEKRPSHSFGTKISKEDAGKLAAFVKELGKKK